MTQAFVEVAIAILDHNGQFLMQLRDNIPGIVYPGCWGFFGGHLEAGEDPWVTVRRELIEEIGFNPPILNAFRQYRDERVLRHVFYAPLTVSVDTLTLNEGWDMGLLTPDDIQRGDRYSAKAGEARPLGQIHRQILLDFLSSDRVTSEFCHG